MPALRLEEEVDRMKQRERWERSERRADGGGKDERKNRKDETNPGARKLACALGIITSTGHAVNTDR